MPFYRIPPGLPPAEVALLQRVQEALRALRRSPRTAEAYCMWIQRFFAFHRHRPVAQLERPEIEAYLTHLANVERVSASSQNQALAALLFLYLHVLGVALDRLGDFTRAKPPQRIPTVLTPMEVAAVLERMRGVPRLMTALLYGAGLRLMECCRLRVKDLDLERSSTRRARGARPARPAARPVASGRGRIVSLGAPVSLPAARGSP